MTYYADLLKVLEQAEARVADESLPAALRERSAETVSLCEKRMASEGITRGQLYALAV